jgi:hypothetical protein
MAQSVNERKSVAYLAATILITAILVFALTTVLVSPSRSETTTTETSTIAATETSTTTATETTTVTSIATEYLNINASGDVALLADCSSAQVGNPGFEALVAETSSPAVVCVQLYEFSSTSPVVLNSTELLTIAGYADGQLFRGAGNFTIVPSVDQFVLGGPTNANEGIVLAYGVMAKPGASGTYEISINGWQLEKSEPLQCAGCAGLLVAGNGRPNYAVTGDCRTFIATNSTSFTIPGVTYDILSNTLYYKIIAMTNSTQ